MPPPKAQPVPPRWGEHAGTDQTRTLHQTNSAAYILKVIDRSSEFRCLRRDGTKRNLGSGGVDVGRPIKSERGAIVYRCPWGLGGQWGATPPKAIALGSVPSFSGVPTRTAAAAPRRRPAIARQLAACRRLPTHAFNRHHNGKHCKTPTVPRCHGPCSGPAAGARWNAAHRASSPGASPAPATAYRPVTPHAASAIHHNAEPLCVHPVRSCRRSLADRISGIMASALRVNRSSGKGRASPSGFSLGMRWRGAAVSRCAPPRHRTNQTLLHFVIRRKFTAPFFCWVFCWVEIKNAPKGASLLRSWRRGRDSNPRWGISPHTLSRRAT